MHSANEIADHLLLLARKRGMPLENLKLQKLLYYAQAWHLALYDRPLFADDLEAWIYGPAVSSVYRRFQEYGIRNIDADVPAPVLTDEERALLDEVAAEYLRFDRYELALMSQRESPWANARGSLPRDEPSDAKIAHDDMRGYFRSRLAARAG